MSTDPPQADHSDSSVDVRSVGELLMDADLSARQMMWDPNPDTAKLKASTWVEMVEAAGELWSAIPDNAADPAMTQIAQHARSLHRSWRRTSWPGTTDPDPHLEHITNNLTRATTLVAHRRHPSAPLSPAGHLDAEAARTRLMHVLYVATHAVSTALAVHVRDLQRQSRSKRGISPGDSPVRASVAKDQLRVVEQLARTYLHHRWPAALDGEHHPPVLIDRLEHALARWDIQAHRTLAAAPTVVNLLYTSQVQRDLTVATTLVTSAAANQGLIDADTRATRLQPALTDLEQSWAALSKDLTNLNGPRRRPGNRDLVLAGNEVRAALREITHDQASIASPTQMGERTDLTAATTNLQRTMPAAIHLSYALREAFDDPGFTVSAKGANTLALANNPSEQLEAWVDPHDLHHDRQITPPPPVQQNLLARIDTITVAALALDSASTFLNQQPAAPSPPNLGTAIDGRSHADRQPATPAPATPRLGRDR